MIGKERKRTIFSAYELELNINFKLLEYEKFKFSIMQFIFVYTQVF